jgi:hypothetical protein
LVRSRECGFDFGFQVDRDGRGLLGSLQFGFGMIFFPNEAVKYRRYCSEPLGALRKCQVVGYLLMPLADICQFGSKDLDRPVRTCNTQFAFGDRLEFSFEPFSSARGQNALADTI